MEKKEKQVLSVELDDEVKKDSTTGMSSDEKVVMHQELNEDDLDNVTGGSNRFDEVEPIKEWGKYYICTGSGPEFR